MTDMTGATVSSPTPEEWAALRVLRQRIFDHYLAVARAGGEFQVDSVAVEFPSNHAEHDFNNPKFAEPPEYAVVIYYETKGESGYKTAESRYTFPTLGKCVAVASAQVEVWIATGEMEDG